MIGSVYQKEGTVDSTPEADVAKCRKEGSGQKVGMRGGGGDDEEKRLADEREVFS
jgi:hypothetical protein